MRLPEPWSSTSGERYGAQNTDRRSLFLTLPSLLSRGSLCCGGARVDQPPLIHLRPVSQRVNNLVPQLLQTVAVRFHRVLGQLLVHFLQPLIFLQAGRLFRSLYAQFLLDHFLRDLLHNLFADLLRSSAGMPYAVRLSKALFVQCAKRLFAHARFVPFRSAS